jgi:Big-like domain-containing protein
MIFGRTRTFLSDLEQVHVRSLNSRNLRLEAVATLGLVLAVFPAAAQQVATHTALSVETRDQGGRTQATASITVTGADGLPVAGVVNIDDADRQLAQVALNGEGQATSVVALTSGDHALRAVYTGDDTHRGSVSGTSDTTGQSTSTPSFTLSLAAVAPSTLPLTVSPGGTGTIAVTITPQDNTALTSPMFITLSCSGLPSLAACTFTPETIEILPTTPASCSAGSPASSCPPLSSMLIQTQGFQARQANPNPAHGSGSHAIAWAILLPVALGLGGLAWGARRRAWLSRLALLALLGVITTLGTTSCKELYKFYENGPSHPPATPTGTFTVTVTGQSSNGVTAIANSTTMVLTVQ